MTGNCFLHALILLLYRMQQRGQNYNNKRLEKYANGCPKSVQRIISFHSGMQTFEMKEMTGYYIIVILILR